MRANEGALNTLCLIGGLAVMTAASASAGHYYEAVSRSEVAGQPAAIETTVKAWVDGDRTRVELVGSDESGWLAEGNYIISSDGGETAYLIDPDKETYASFSLEEMMSGLGRVMSMMEQAGGMMQMEFTDVSSEKLLEESGEELLGRATTHYRFKSRYTMSMSMMGIQQESTTETVQDVWSAHDLDARGFGVWIRPDRGLRTGNEGLDQLFEQELSKLQGFPLKMTTQSTTTNSQGTTQTSSSTEVTVLREEPIPDSLFEWPAHFTETELFSGFGGMGEGLQGQPGGDGAKGLDELLGQGDRG